MTVDRAHTRPQYLQRAALLIHALAGRHRVGQFGIVVHDGTPGDKHLHFLQPGQFAPLSVYDLAHKIEQTTADPQGQVVADLPEAVVALLDRRTRQGASSGGTQVLLITESHFHLAAASKWHTGPGRWAWTINTRRLAGGPLSLAACLWKDLATARDETFRQVLEHLVLLGYQARCAHGLVRMWTPTSPYKLDRWAAAESDSLCAVSDRVTARAAQQQGVDTPGLPRPRTVWVTREHGELAPKTLHRHELMGGIEQDNLSDRPPSEEHVSFAYSGPLPSADAIRARLIGILRPTK